MFFQSSACRLMLVAVVILSLVFLVSASPIATPVLSTDVFSPEKRNENCYEDYCFGGLGLETLLLQLQQAVEFKLALLDQFLKPAHTDDCLTGGDYASILLDIEGILLAANGAIRGYQIGLLELVTGKLSVIAKIWADIVVSVATHCSRWSDHHEFKTFLGFIVKIDLALKLCLLSIVNLGGFFGRFIRVCGDLFTDALLLKVKFGLYLSALGLGGYY
ncbi:hypothetical protein BDV93DRAFT_505950 [Ceratobasidium sp. AG-I]|nr:hypothetical protein BDV93DRAFT_505950 [Ceratobasidium sp. AG-I]